MFVLFCFVLHASYDPRASVLFVPKRTYLMTIGIVFTTELENLLTFNIPKRKNLLVRRSTKKTLRIAGESGA